MKWVELSIKTTQEATDAVSYMLHEIGASGVVIEDPFELIKERENVYGEIFALDPNDFPKEGVIVKSYFLSDKELEGKLCEIKEKLSEFKDLGIDMGKGTMETSLVDEEDWAHAWKKYYHPIQVTSKFTIVPTWEEYERKSQDEHIIELDPGMAFGTGTHPTTMMCLQAIQDYVLPDQTVVDVGTGTGVLAIGSALVGVKQVFAYDLDDVAVESAHENIVHNQVQKIVHVGKSNLLNEYHGKADVIIGNLLAEIVVLLSPQANEKLLQGGLFIVSGIISQKKEVVISKLEEDSFEIIKIYEMNDWIAICARKI